MISMIKEYRGGGQQVVSLSDFLKVLEMIKALAEEESVGERES